MSTEREDYVRVKRKNQTFFVNTSPSDSFAHIKAEISKAMGGDDVVSPKQMRLYVESSKPAVGKPKADGDEDDDGDEKMGAAAEVASRDLVPDAALLSDHDVKNDAVLYLTFAKAWEDGDDVPDGDDGWEEIEVVKP